MPKKPPTVELNQRFGGRVVIDPTPVIMSNSTRRNRTYVLCRCDCGQVDMVPVSRLVAGTSTQCAQCVRTSHGLSKRPEYRIWASMIQRCHDAEHPSHARYAHVSVCDEWRGRGGFTPFFEHVGPRPSDKHSIDRTDNSGNYEPGNVQWATPKQQARNRRNTPMLTINGVTKSVSEWADVAKVKYHTFRKRLKLGWSPEDAVRGVRSDRPKHRTRKDTPRYEIGGVTKTLHEWADQAGVSSSTFRARIEKLGWSPGEALVGKRV